MIAQQLAVAIESPLSHLRTTSEAQALLPPSYDLVWSGSTILVITVIVVALVSIARHTDELSSTATAVWSAVVVFVPVIGGIVWFLIGRPAARASRLTSPRRVS